MKIVNRETFLALPEGTVYAKYYPQVFGELCIKSETWTTDWWYQNIRDAINALSSEDWSLQLDLAEQDGESIAMDFHSVFRDGLFDKSELYAVWEKDDVQGLIQRLQEAVDAAYKE